MFRTAFRLGLLLVALAVTAAPASAQITWNVTYNGTHWNDSTPNGTSTLGQLRRDSVTAATLYLNTVLDGRGTTNITLTSSGFGSPNPLANFGPNKIGTFDVGDGFVLGTFQNGGVYQSARTNTTPAPFASQPDGQGTVFFGHNYHYAVAGSGTTLAGGPGGTIDLVSVMIHELTHGLGIVAFADPGTPTGVKDQFTEWERSLQRGNTPGSGALFATNITQSNYGTFLGPTSTFTGGNTQNPQQTIFTNDGTNGLYFGGKYAREVFNGPVPVYSPTTYNSGSSGAHVNVGPSNIGVMNQAILTGVQRRYQNYEIAILLDMGWNTYDWNGTTGNWSTGTNTGETVYNSRWQTSQGIHVLRWDSSDSFALFNARSPDGVTVYGKAPILPVYGQVTSNIILNFFGSGASSYTSTNDLGNIRLARLNLNSTSTATNTITGGTLQFGVNSDNTASVLTPKIVQENSGAFTIGSNIIVTNTTGAPGGGWTGLTVDGPGAGKVTLSGVISGDGTLTKAGTFELELGGGTANTYSGVTTVNGGILTLAKTAGDAIAGDVTLGTGGTLRLAANNQMHGTTGNSKKVTLSGGTLSTGASTGFSDVVGSLERLASSTIDLGTGSHILQFTGITGTPTGTLTIQDWAGAPGTQGTSGRILFSGIGTTPNVDHATFLSTVNFQGFGTGATFLDQGGGVFELAPVPEPAVVLAVAVATLGLGAAVRRRWRKPTLEPNRLLP
jgi:autotransporter-associated beta strand protein